MADISQIQVAPNEVYDIKDVTARAVATTQSTGQVKPDGTTVTIDADGTIHSTGGGGNLPSGGTRGQVLIKQSSVAGDATWNDPEFPVAIDDTEWTSINTILS